MRQESQLNRTVLEHIFPHTSKQTANLHNFSAATPQRAEHSTESKERLHLQRSGTYSLIRRFSFLVIGSLRNFLHDLQHGFLEGVYATKKGEPLPARLFMWSDLVNRSGDYFAKSNLLILLKRTFPLASVAVNRAKYMPLAMPDAVHVAEW